MYKIATLGQFEALPKELLFVIENDTESIEKKLQKRMSVNKRFFLSEYISLSMLELAVYTANEKMIRWLVERGADTREKYRPTLLLAVRYLTTKTLEYVTQKSGVDFLSEEMKEELFSQIHYGKKYENIDILEKHGIKASVYANSMFHLMTLEKKTNYLVLQKLLDLGIDINSVKNDSVFKNNETPLLTAVRSKNDELALWLIKQGADVKIKNKDGERAYTIAVENGNMKLANIIKELEPKEWHDMKQKLLELKKYKLPKSLLDFLSQETPILDFGGKCEIKYIRFFTLTDVVFGKWKKRNALYISSEIKNYSVVKIVWMDENIHAIDTEHEKVYKLGTWDEFIKNAEKLIMEKIF